MYRPVTYGARDVTREKIDEHTALYERCVRLLVTERQERGLTQAQLAKLIGKPQPFVAKYETLTRRLDIAEFILIAEALTGSKKKLLRNLLDRVGE